MIEGGAFTLVRILVLEDDQAASVTLKRRLEIEGYTVDCVSDSLEAIKACNEHEYDLLILDVMIQGSDIDGVEAASIIRGRSQKEIPLIFLTAACSEEAHIRGLNEGAVAYLTKPISYKVLALQVKNILNNIKGTETDGLKPLVYKDFILDIERNIVRINDDYIRLSPKPMACLAYLIKNKGRVVSKKELSEHVWMGEFSVSDDVINSTINRIRKELVNEIIITHRGFGYEIAP